MIISPIVNNKAYYNKNYATSVNKISFKGQLEDSYFSAAKSGNIQAQLNGLNNIGFNIREIDLATGNNFLHSALKSGDKRVINKALILLGLKTNNNPQLAKEIVEGVNSEGKKPYDYTSDSSILSLIQKFTDKDLKEEKCAEPAIGTYEAINEIPDDEITSLPDIDDEYDEYQIETPNVPPKDNLTTWDDESVIDLNETAGLTKAKKVLLNRIVEPLNNGKKVKDNGFLLYSATKCGKSFLLKSLAKTINKEIITFKDFEKLVEKAVDDTKNDIEKQQKAISEILDKNIIQVTDVQELESAIDFAKENYKNTNKQTIIYIDEIKGILPDVNAASSSFVTKAEQLIEDSASKGFVLVATTRGIDEISPDSIRSGRFDRKIELKLPTKDERKEFIDKYLKLEFEEKTYGSLLSKTAGFSYKDLENFIGELNETQKTDFDSVNKELKNYAKENGLGQLSDSGTTANYDSDEFRRMPINITFNDVAGMNEVKSKFQINLINRLNPDTVKWCKEHGNRPPVRSGFLLYGPPGTGKTFIAEAVAGETKIPLYKIDSSTIKDKYVGESEKKVRKLFRQLETKFEETGEYSILFIDEANSLLANRKKELTSDSLSSNSGDSNLVDLFLQYLNKAPERGIIPIVATNFKEEIDDAILDRLQTQINISLPDDDLRAAMVKKEFSKLPEYTNEVTDDEIKEIVVRLGGFSSRNISAILSAALDKCSTHPDRAITLKDLTDEINNYALEHDLPEINEINKTSGYDGKWKRKNIKFPANFSDVAGMDDIKHIFQTTLIDRLKPEAIERFKKDGNRNPIQSNFLLYGPPGTGKTFIAEALAGEMKVPLYELTSADIKSGLFGESEKNIKSVFEQLEKKYKKTGEYSILFVDEANDLFRSTKNPLGGDTSLTNLFLEKTNNSAQRGIIVIAATNYKDQIEDAMLSRLGKQIYVPLPDEKLIETLIEAEFKNSKITANITEEDKEELVKQLSGFSSRDITNILKEAINEHLTYSSSQMDMDEFRNAINKFNSNNNNLNNIKNTAVNDKLLQEIKGIIDGLSKEDAEDFMNFCLQYKNKKTITEEN